MRFTPLSDAEIELKRTGLSPGPATFEIKQAEEKPSKAGNPTIRLVLKVWDHEGREGTVFDYLSSTLSWRIKDFLKSVGLESLYESGEIEPYKLTGLSGKAILFVQKDAQYGDSIKVKTYLAQESIQKPKAPIIDLEEDEDFEKYLNQGIK